MKFNFASTVPMVAIQARITAALRDEILGIGKNENCSMPETIRVLLEGAVEEYKTMKEIPVIGEEDSSIVKMLSVQIREKNLEKTT